MNFTDQAQPCTHTNLVFHVKLTYPSKGAGTFAAKLRLSPAFRGQEQHYENIGCMVMLQFRHIATGDDLMLSRVQSKLQTSRQDSDAL